MLLFSRATASKSVNFLMLGTDSETLFMPRIVRIDNLDPNPRTGNNSNSNPTSQSDTNPKTGNTVLVLMLTLTLVLSIILTATLPSL